jgi:hypothetical protein
LFHHCSGFNFIFRVRRLKKRGVFFAFVYYPRFPFVLGPVTVHGFKGAQRVLLARTRAARDADA